MINQNLQVRISITVESSIEGRLTVNIYLLYTFANDNYCIIMTMYDVSFAC